MKLSESPDLLKRFRRTPWRFQQTFATPLKNLSPFVQTIICAFDELQEVTLVIDLVVFEPKHLIGLLTKHSLPPQYIRGTQYTAIGSQEVSELLEAALNDWVDFLFLPTPKPFVIYADHDEYTTFYANTKSNLNRVCQPLLRNDFAIIENFERRL
jgi:hypothetical protein